MGEWKRILASRKFAAVLLLLAAVNLFFYLFSQWGGNVPLEDWLDQQKIYREQLDVYREIPIQEAYEQAAAEFEKLRDGGDWQHYGVFQKIETQLESLAGWDAYLEGVQDSADRVLQFSIFQDEGGFTYQNTIKTAREYGELSGIKLELGHDEALTSVLGSTVTDYLLVFWMLLFVMAFLQERRRGLWAMVYAAPRGRIWLGARRIGVLFVAALGGTVLLTGGCFGLGCAIYGIPEMNRAVQSVPLLMGITQEWSVGSFVIVYFLTKALSVFMTGLSLYAILGAFRSLPAALVALGGVMGAEYVLYQTLSLQSRWAVLKYGNLSAFIETGSLFTRYLNVNLFNIPVDFRAIGWIMMGLLAALGAAVILWSQGYKRPTGHRSLFAPLAMMANRGLDALRTRLPLWAAECHKVLFLQKGWVVWIVLVLWMYAGSLGVPVMETTEESLANQFCERHMGPVDEETQKAVSSWETRIQEAIAEQERIKAAYQAGEMTAGEYESAMNEYTGTDIQQNALYIVQDRLRQAEETGVWLISFNAFERYFSPAAYPAYQLAMGVLLLVLAVTLGGMQASEEENGVRNMTRAARWGRRGLWRAKVLAALLLSGLCSGLYTLSEAAQIAGVLPEGAFAAPAASVIYFRQVPAQISLGGLYGILLTLRLIVAWSVAGLILWISTLCKQTNVGQGASAVLLAGPAILSYIGVSLLNILSPAGAMSGFLLFGSEPGFWAYGLWIALGAAGWLLARKRWV